MALTPEEERELIELELAQLEEQQAMDAASLGERRAEPGQSKLSQLGRTLNRETSSDRLRGVGTAVSSGATFGWGDEISSGIAAGIAKLAGDDKPYMDIYRDIHGSETDRQKSYEEAHPGEALALNVAGGLATGGMGAARGLAMLPKATSRLGRLGTGAAVMAGEGGLAGAGFANPGERMEGAKLGAALGVGAGAGLNLATKTLRGISARNKVVPDLIQNGKQVPMHLAAPKGASRMVDFYRDMVGGSWGGHGSLAKQERPFIEAAEQGVEKAAAQRELLQEAAENVKLRYGSDKLAADLADVEAAAQSKTALKQTLRAAKQQAAQAAKDEEEVVRRLVLDDAMPAEMNAAKRQEILGLAPQKAAKELDNWWDENGFQMVKGRKFEWQSDLGPGLKNLLSENPWIALELGDMSKKVKGMTATLQKLTNAVGDDTTLSLPMMLDGESLMAMRNVFAIAANKTKDAARSASLRAVKNQFDDMIRSQLGASDQLFGTKTLNAFDDHLKRWGSERMFLDNVAKAKKKGGYFDPEDAMAQLKGGKAVAFGEGRNQEAITAAIAAKEARKEALSQLEQTLKDQAAASGLARTLAKTQAGWRMRREAGGQRRSLDKQGKALVQSAKKKMEEVDQRKLRNRSFFEKMARTTLLGLSPAIAPLATGSGAISAGALALPLGVGMSSMLARPATQRMMAGQTGWQKALSAQLRKRQKEIDAATRGLYRSAAMQGQEE